MILISNKPVDIRTIMAEYPARSVERLIINKMDISSHPYAYKTLNELRFELRLRKEIVEASKALNNSRMAFDTFRKSRCNPQYWNRTDEGGFKLKENAKASDAINDIFANGRKYGTECATAMVIVYYKALLNVYSERLFNKIFKKIHLMNWHYLDPLLAETGFLRDKEDYLPGDRRYFMNPDVSPETPYWQGENVIDLGNGMYYGHGVGIYNADVFIRVLNRNRRESGGESAYLLDSVGRPNFKKLAALYENPIAAEALA